MLPRDAAGLAWLAGLGGEPPCSGIVEVKEGSLSFKNDMACSPDVVSSIGDSILGHAVRDLFQSCLSAS